MHRGRRVSQIELAGQKLAAHSSFSSWAGFRFFGNEGLVADAKVKLNLSIPTTTHVYPDGITPAHGDRARH